MKIINFRATATTAIISLLMSGCSAPAPTPVPVPEVHVKLSEFKIELDRPSVPAGKVKFIVTNTGTITHELVLEEATAVDVPLNLDGQQAEIADVAGGKSASAEWNISKPGVYRLACHVKENNIDHFGVGMTTVFTVTAQ